MSNARVSIRTCKQRSVSVTTDGRATTCLPFIGYLVRSCVFFLRFEFGSFQPSGRLHPRPCVFFYLAFKKIIITYASKQAVPNMSYNIQIAHIIFALYSLCPNKLIFNLHFLLILLKNI